jgi:hypothetical protein
MELMEILGDGSWKDYYSGERERSISTIDEKILELWEKEDPVVDDVMKSNGILSFPHTCLSSSMIPLIRTVRSILKTGKKKIIAFGVMHGISGFDPINEFSLDGFRFILHRTGEILGMEVPDTVEYFLPPSRVDPERPVRIIEDLSGFVDASIPSLDPQTAIVLTGDLSHYGPFYGTEKMEGSPERSILSWIERGLELVFLEKDYRQYLEHSFTVKNDQWAPAIAASMLLPDNLSFEMISCELTDYSFILGTDPPCLVASVFYKVIPRD